MFENLITVSETPAWYNYKYLARLIARNERKSYYLSCWRLLSDQRRQDREQLEDHQALNWKCEVEKAQAEEWLNLLRYQSIIVAPSPPSEQERDGSIFSFAWEERNQRLQLNWHNDTPVGWEVAGVVTQLMLEIAEAHAPDEAKI